MTYGLKVEEQDACLVCRNVLVVQSVSARCYYSASRLFLITENE